MTNLYFLDKDHNQHLVAEDVDEENAWEYVEADLNERHPESKVYCTRQWWDNYFRHWIDYGSHTEFYIMQKPEQALNLIEDKEAKKTEKKMPCHEDYCEIE